MVTVIGEIEVQDMNRIHLSELERLQKDNCMDEEGEGDMDIEGDFMSDEEKKIKLLKCKVKGDYFEVTRLLIQNNIPIIQ